MNEKPTFLEWAESKGHWEVIKHHENYKAYLKDLEKQKESK